MAAALKLGVGMPWRDADALPRLSIRARMRQIALFGREGIVGHALVDDEDFERLNQRRWCLSSRSDPWPYAVTVTKDGGERLAMHRLVVSAPEGMAVDHINGNTLDNRKENLRIVTIQANSENQAVRRNNRSGFRGVHQVKRSGRWKAVVEHRGKKHVCGTFATAEEAGRAAAAKRRELGFRGRADEAAGERA